MYYGLGNDNVLTKQIHHLGYNSSYNSSLTLFATVGNSNDNTEESTNRRNILISSTNDGIHWSDHYSTTSHHYPIKYVSDDSVATRKPMFGFTIDDVDPSNVYRQVIRSESYDVWDIISKKAINDSEATSNYQISPGCYFPPLGTVIGVERSTGNLYYYNKTTLYMEQVQGLSLPEQSTPAPISICYSDGNTTPSQIWEYIEYDETNNLLIGISPTINKVAIISNAWTNNNYLCYYIKFVSLPSIPLTPLGQTNSWHYVSANGGRIIISALLSASSCYSIDGGNTWKQLDVSKTVSGDTFFTTEHTILYYEPIFDSYIFTNTQISNVNYHPVAGIISPYRWSDSNHILEEQITRINTQIDSINAQIVSLMDRDTALENRLGVVENDISQLKELMSSLLSVGSVVQFGATGATPSLPSTVGSTGTWNLVNEINYIHDGTSYNVNSWMKTMESNNSS